MTRALADLGRGGWNPSGWQRPPWADVVLARRLLAAALAVLAAVLFVRGDPDAERMPILVAARDLEPGRLLEEGDLRSAPREAGTLPAGAVGDPAALLGATLTGAMRQGEVFTDLRVIGPRLAAAATGARDARIVPIRLADTAVADILRAGDRVDVIGAEDSNGPGTRPARTLATDAAVILVSGQADERGAAERVVLVAMDADHATAVAGASLRTALAVVFH
ncbi:SAF domain-containing protein [Nocardia sp. NBC_00508]|uniref:SAF domain-containing protein n=1 Tax=Nocardia sp. NBC_00508 TaxID=2975992 RepID=UPI002E81A057|nr:SAF domain-containing protein [Nocardia sp. NBC_00508]WUD64025.1 SAF domain-containing protein [Nocardia sp. NBC_00508]